MVVHLSPGHTTGTLVNALLAHCGLPACDAVPSGSSGGSGGGLFSGQAVLGGMLQDDDDLDEAEEFEAPPVPAEASVVTAAVERSSASMTAAGTSTPQPAAARRGAIRSSPPVQSDDATGSTPAITSTGGDGRAGGWGGSSSTTGSGSNTGIVRPGIVHRLDRGTSGLMVVAKTDFVHAALCQQFKERSVSRIYNSITVGVPSPAAARVATNIVRWVDTLNLGIGCLLAGLCH